MIISNRLEDKSQETGSFLIPSRDSEGLVGYMLEFYPINPGLTLTWGNSQKKGHLNSLLLINKVLLIKL